MVYSRESEMVLGARLVEVGEVNTHPPLPVGFAHHYLVSEPLWVEDFSDKASFKKFVEFFVYRVRISTVFA